MNRIEQFNDAIEQEIQLVIESIQHARTEGQGSQYVSLVGVLESLTLSLNSLREVQNYD